MNEENRSSGFWVGISELIAFSTIIGTIPQLIRSINEPSVPPVQDIEPALPSIEEKYEQAKQLNYTDSTAGINLEVIYVKPFCLKKIKHPYRRMYNSDSREAADMMSHERAMEGCSFSPRPGTFYKEISETQAKVFEKSQIPKHIIDIDCYYLGKSEITQHQWQAIMGYNPIYHKVCDSCPVENVSWNEVQLFIEKLNELSGKNYRLPTESEWEIAARYKTTKPGIPINNSNNHTLSVSENNPGDLLYEMSGNVMEWCEDNWHENYNEAPPDGSAWLGSLRNNHKVARGRSYSDTTTVDYKTVRHKFEANKKYKNVVFRLARNK